MAIKLKPMKGGWDLAEWLERQTANVVVATVPSSIQASSDTVESEGWQMKQCWISYVKNKVLPKEIALTSGNGIFFEDVRPT